jgi:hypothetical protein
VKEEEVEIARGGHSPLWNSVALVWAINWACWVFYESSGSSSNNELVSLIATLRAECQEDQYRVDGRGQSPKYRFASLSLLQMKLALTIQ